MRHRLRSAAIIVHRNRMLLVCHVDPDTGETFWVPPGGGIEACDSSVWESAKRETLEETGLDVILDRPIYLREFYDTGLDTNNIELFFIASGFSGDLTIRNVQGSGPDEHWIKDVRWLSREEMASVTVYPDLLTTSFWDDFEAGFAHIKYLGRQASHG
jgi:8-oxo-dGTP diphosphatase